MSRAPLFTRAGSIALAGADVTDLDKATWAQVPREAYMTAARFCVAHSSAYQDLHIDEEAAKLQFKDLVPDAIKALATPVHVDGGVVAAACGPASDECQEVKVQASVVDDDEDD